MTDQELKECIAEVKYSDMHDKAKKKIINALLEVQKYKEIGTVEEFVVANYISNAAANRMYEVREEVRNLLKCYCGDSDAMMKVHSFEEHIEMILRMLD